MRLCLVVMALLAAAVAAAKAAPAEEPAAMAEEISGTADPVRAFDYLRIGKSIALGHDGRLVVDYLRSCTRETITGGTVTIGLDHSLVSGGSVQAEKIECDGAGLRLTAAQAMNIGALVMRKLQRPSDSAYHVNETIHGTAPLIDFGAPLPLESDGKLRLAIERLDAAAAPLALEIAPRALAHGRLYDFAAAGRALVPGGVYRLTRGEVSTVVRVDLAATAGAGPVLGRLIRL